MVLLIAVRPCFIRVKVMQLRLDSNFEIQNQGGFFTGSLWYITREAIPRKFRPDQHRLKLDEPDSKPINELFWNISLYSFHSFIWHIFYMLISSISTQQFEVSFFQKFFLPPKHRLFTKVFIILFFLSPNPILQRCLSKQSFFKDILSFSLGTPAFDCGI